MYQAIVVAIFALVSVYAGAFAPALAEEVLNPDVTQQNISTNICVSGYTKVIRPSTSYTNGVKKLLMKRSGLDLAEMRSYELDHIIPLTLGGHPRNPKNLMLQKWEGEDGAKVKDKLEVRLNKLVCSGKVDLREAQADIYYDWQAAYAKYEHMRSKKKRRK